MPFIGNTVRIILRFRDWEGNLADPSTATIRFFDSRRKQLGEDAAIDSAHREGLGVYAYEYQIPSLTGNQVVYEAEAVVEGSVAVVRQAIPIRWV